MCFKLLINKLKRKEKVSQAGIHTPASYRSTPESTGMVSFTIIYTSYQGKKGRKSKDNQVWNV